MTRKPSHTADTGNERVNAVQGVQSVEIGMRVAATVALSGPGGMALNDIAKATGMAAGKVHRYLVSLCQEGLIEQRDRSGRYDLGWAAIRLGLGAQLALPHIRECEPIIHDLQVEGGLAIAAAIWTDKGPVIIRKAESYGQLMMDTRIGVPIPVGNTSIGRVFAAYLPTAMSAPLLAAERRNNMPPGDSMDRGQFTSLLKSIREHGLASQSGDFLAGLQALAAPVFDERDEIVMAISMLAPANSPALSPHGPNARKLLAAASRLSRRIREIAGEG